MLRRLLCALFLLPTLLCSSAMAAEKIIVATNPEWPPMEFLDDNKQIIGYDMDMMTAIGKEVGLEVEFRMTAWDGIFAGIAAGNYDVIASAVTITPERQKAFAFTVPYYDVQQIVVLRKGDSAENFEALKGRVLGGQIGTTGIFVAQKSGVDMTIREYDSVGLAMQDLLNSRIDAVICDSPVALYYANQKEGFADHLTVAFRTEATESFGFVVQKNRKDLVERLNKGIEAVRAKGIEAELIRKWLGD
ncbi:basic amino acid ABC transporter substrate-binding protein [Mailhella massiliensis]|uniref:Basic amino acid ABC transporter substrate-binding protein n=1 Tax=Mailhella massiliensis TaxID=1903261 RepID=A0A921AXR6_9BACT|nr:basic amino acid ABC transporter substrate-binding protein [Mailhella massiliensis]HJD97846.1 basic amino acid ABC transporter substrate-binding protein [Mailhella massiliensis]